MLVDFGLLILQLEQFLHLRPLYRPLRTLCIKDDFVIVFVQIVVASAEK